MEKYQFLWQALEKIEYGEITINLLESNKTLNFKASNPQISSQISFKNEKIILELVIGGDVAFGEAYIRGDWDSENLINLLTFLTMNAKVLERFFHTKKIQFFLLYLKNLFRKNTLLGSKKNISFHYDLGNEFYQLWLDKTMTYSSALFSDEKQSLMQAQIQKYHNILEKLSGATILEIGCGWGGFIEQAIQKNFQITGLTLSTKQKQFAEKRLEKFNDKFVIKLQDYRLEQGVYDNIVSIEMFEAVGQQYWDKYFEILNKALKVNGKAVLQIITIDEEVFKDYKNRVDFIQKHIFPGGVLPSNSTIHHLASKHNFTVKSELSFAKDYVKTLKIWLENFDQKISEVKQLGFKDDFIRKWRFYLAYCISGFSVERTNVVQFELIKK